MVLKEQDDEWESSVDADEGEALIANRELIGPRRWGIAHLYYRAGLTQQDIADVFGLSRQCVAKQLRQARRMLAWARRKR